MMKRKRVVIPVLAIVAVAALLPVFGTFEKSSEEEEITRSADGIFLEEKGAESLDGFGAPEPRPATAPDEAIAIEGAVLSAGSALTTIGPRVIQTAFLQLLVPEGKFEETVERARTVVAGLGGFVTSSSASQGPDGRLVRGALVVRVPERSYARAVSQLSRMGEVEGREESGQDVSAEVVDLESRARHLEAVEAQLLKLLERANSVADALAVQSQLNAVQLELEQVRGRIRFLDDQTSFATISLSVREEPSVVAGEKKDGWGIIEAWRDGAEGFVRVTAAVFVALATAAPILILMAVALVLGRIVVASRRRSRSSAPQPAQNTG